MKNSVKSDFEVLGSSPKDIIRKKVDVKVLMDYLIEEGKRIVFDGDGDAMFPGKVNFVWYSEGEEMWVTYSHGSGWQDQEYSYFDDEYIYNHLWEKRKYINNRIREGIFLFE